MEVRLTLQELAEISSHGFPRVSCYGQYGSQVGNSRKWSKMAENRSQVKKDDICQKWQEIDFRVFHVVVIEVTRKTIAEMVENGGKLISAVIW